jgi:hypothetical protein
MAYYLVAARLRQSSPASPRGEQAVQKSLQVRVIQLRLLV